MQTVQSTDLSFPVFRRGKVRDVYTLNEQLLIVATDRISAFDVIMGQGIPEKGRILTQVANFWFKATQDIIPNHLITTCFDEFPEELKKHAELKDRAILVRKTQPLPVECVVRGYLAGSGLKEYEQSRTVCGVKLPEGLVNASKLPEPIFTPATKEDEGHDINISFERMCEIVGEDLGKRLRDVSIQLYLRGVELAAKRGIILADTKFEFGLLPDGQLIVIDEVLTPDSSRYWLADQWKPGINPPSLDKQFLRDYLETLKDWNKQAPAPELPAHIIEGIRERYLDLAKRFDVV